MSMWRDEQWFAKQQKAHDAERERRLQNLRDDMKETEERDEKLAAAQELGRPVSRAELNVLTERLHRAEERIEALERRCNRSRATGN